MARSRAVAWLRLSSARLRSEMSSTIVMMRELPESHGEQFGARVAEQVAEAIVDPEKVSIETGMRYADSRLLEGGPEPLFALAECGFGIL